MIICKSVTQKLKTQINIFTLTALLFSALVVPQANVFAADGDPQIVIDNVDANLDTVPVDVYFGGILQMHVENADMEVMEAVIEKYTTPDKLDKIQMAPSFNVVGESSAELALTAPGKGKELSDFTPGYYILELVDYSGGEGVVLDSQEFNVISSATGAKIDVLNPDDINVDGTLKFSTTYKLKGNESFEASPQELDFADTRVYIQSANGTPILDYGVISSAFPSDLYTIEGGIYTVKVPADFMSSNTTYKIAIYGVGFNFAISDTDYGTLLEGPLATATFTTQKKFTVVGADIKPDEDQNFMAGEKFVINTTFNLEYEDGETSTVSNISQDLFEFNFYYGSNGLTPVEIPEGKEVITDLGDGTYEINLDADVFTKGHYTFTVERRTEDLVKPWDSLGINVEPYLLTSLNENLSANLSPSFDSLTTSYTLAATANESSVVFGMKFGNADSVSLFVTSDNDSNITVVQNVEAETMDATVDLLSGVNTVNIKVTSSFGDIGDVEQIYTIVVTKAAPSEDGNGDGGGSGNGGGGGSTGGGSSSSGKSTTKKIETKKVVETLETTSTTCADTKAVFTDISGHWAKSFIEQLASNGVVSGKSVGVYAPNEYLTRAEAAKIVLCNLNVQVETGDTGFSDTTDHWGTDIIATAKKMGIVHGYPDGTFKPNSPVTRAEIIVMLLNAQGINSGKAPVANLSDLDQTAWYAGAVNFAYENGVVSGYGDGTFGPHNHVTRGEVAKIALLISQL